MTKGMMMLFYSGRALQKFQYKLMLLKRTYVGIMFLTLRQNFIIHYVTGLTGVTLFKEL